MLNSLWRADWIILVLFFVGPHIRIGFEVMVVTIALSRSSRHIPAALNISAQEICSAMV